MNETNLIEKLIKIEALFAGAATEGERISAGMARQRILARLEELLPKEPAVEYKFTFADMWSRKVFTTLLRRYDLKPYRYYRQRYTTVMVKAPKTFVDETLWPEFQKINSELGTYLQEVTDRVVKEVLHEDSSDAVVVDKPVQIGLDQSVISKGPINTEDKKPEMPPDIRKTGHPKKKKKRKKKRRNR
ncbi:MAG: hypothetical protein SRB1_00754 [Desulfobacteraceae bacterium Eth-SRB1]|nr:MAG: hypothetical protein SRB1_00754 [Desulfobacteraceae bacterium Eth-SRB1]